MTTSIRFHICGQTLNYYSLQRLLCQALFSKTWLPWEHRFLYDLCVTSNTPFHSASASRAFQCGKRTIPPPQASAHRKMRARALLRRRIRAAPKTFPAHATQRRADPRRICPLCRFPRLNRTAKRYSAASLGASENARQSAFAATYTGSAKNIPHTPPNAEPAETASNTVAGLAPAAVLITRGEMP